MCACFARQQGEEQSEVGGSGGVCFTEPAHTHSLHFHATKTHGGRAAARKERRRVDLLPASSGAERSKSPWLAVGNWSSGSVSGAGDW